MRNVLSIDLEDWHQLVHRRITGEPLQAPTRNVFRQMDRLLGLLDEHDTKATFFIMSVLAERFPEIVRRVAEEGHEVASHGHAHRLVYNLTPRAFREDTRRSKAILEDLTGQPVRGYRAPEFSVHRRALWALGVLAEEGFTYDSSIFPIRHRRYGIPGFNPHARHYALLKGERITEVPPSTVALGSTRLPVAGGGYFRYLPAAVIKRIVQRLHAQGQPLVTYFHPYEFDTQRLDIFKHLKPTTWKTRARGHLFNAHQNVGRAGLAGKVAMLLDTFSFTTFRDYLSHARIEESSQLLPPDRRRLPRPLQPEQRPQRLA